MATPVVVVGGGGMGHCVLDVIDRINAQPGADGLEVIGVVDDGEPVLEHLEARGVVFLGPVDALHGLAADVGYVIGVGSPRVKKDLDTRLSGVGRPSPVLVHPNVHVGFGVVLGAGAVVCSHVSIESRAVLGRHVHVNQNSTVGHDSRLDDFSTVSPLCAVSGHVHVEPCAFLGTGAAVRQGLRIGEDAAVGMGAAVVADVASGATVVGVPARPR